MLDHPTFSSWPSFSEEEAESVKNILLSNKVNYWTGDETKLLEQEFASWTGARFAIGLTNGTVALDLALIALGIGPGDEVIVTPRTFIASISCVVSVGAKPVFADVDLDSGNITAETISRVLSQKTKAIICVHLAGWPCDMDPISILAASHNLKGIEHCAQAHGAVYKGRSVGNIGHIGAWSFCQDKIMTTGGEGGMVTTNDEALWRKMWSYKDHGKNYGAVFEREHPPGFRWVHESFGTNWRMLEMQAAIGRIQLRKISAWSARRSANAKLILETCRQFSAIRAPHFYCNQSCLIGNCCDQNCQHAYYKLYVYVDKKHLKSDWNRDRIIEEINNQGVPCFHGGCSEVYLEKAFDNGFRPEYRLQNAKKLGEESVMFLVHPTLTSENISRTCNAINSVMSLANQ